VNDPIIKLRLSVCLKPFKLRASFDDSLTIPRRRLLAPTHLILIQDTCHCSPQSPSITSPSDILHRFPDKQLTLEYQLDLSVTQGHGKDHFPITLEYQLHSAHLNNPPVKSTPNKGGSQEPLVFLFIKLSMSVHPKLFKLRHLSYDGSTLEYQLNSAQLRSKDI
jgi:hypothetical protein